MDISEGTRTDERKRWLVYLTCALSAFESTSVVSIAMFGVCSEKLSTASQATSSAYVRCPWYACACEHVRVCHRCVPITSRACEHLISKVGTGLSTRNK
jgi:hypothetical protein